MQELSRQFLTQSFLGLMVDHPNLLVFGLFDLMELSDNLEALILEGDIFKIRLWCLIRDGVTLFVELGLSWHLGDLDADDSSDLIVGVLSIKIHSRLRWFLFFSILRFGVLLVLFFAFS